METSTTIRQMFAGNEIFVPNYQRAYAWEKDKHVAQFLKDLEDYTASCTESKYYFGHFLFEKTSDEKYGVIDGQQRMTTIVIFLAALFKCLKSLRLLSEAEETIYEDIIKRKSLVRLKTVDYDNRFFKDYVVEGTRSDKEHLETESQKKIAEAYDYFTIKLKQKGEDDLQKLLISVANAACTTHQVNNESESIQMFIFQNNRGKKPTNLEVIKALFMYNVHLYGGEDTQAILTDIKERFEQIYRAISSIEANIDEDDVLIYTQRTHFNSLWESNTIKKVNDELAKPDTRIEFIKTYTQALADNFRYLQTFFGEDGKANYDIHSLAMLDTQKGIFMPFVLKAYKFDLPIEEKCRLCRALETLFVRQGVIRRGAQMENRLNDVYQNFSVDDIVGRINLLKTTQNWWWKYWDDEQFFPALQGWIERGLAKFLLWKYENHLQTQGKNGYGFTPFNSIPNKHLEHIAPQTKNENPAAGYCEYDDDFKENYLECLGNYLLLSESHNCSIGNAPFAEKRATYTHLLQQQEVREMTAQDCIWDKVKIGTRRDKIIDFLKQIYG